MRNVLVVVVAVAVGCASSPPTERAGSVTAGTASPPVVANSPKAPMTVEWLLKGEANGTLTLVARVNRHAPMRVPVTVAVNVPPGVQIVSGKASWVIEPSESIEPVDETLVVNVVQSGTHDILLAADAEGANFGVHAKKTYSVGSSRAGASSAEAKTTTPSSSGPNLEVGGHNFGPSVPAKP